MPFQSKNHGAMLSSMLLLVTNTHTIAEPDARISILHPMRTMANLKSNNEELNCIALGHELLNHTAIKIGDLVRAGMSDRVITGLILLKDCDTIEESIENVCQTYDTMRVGLACLIDRGPWIDLTTLTTVQKLEVTTFHASYLKISAAMKAYELAKQGVGLK